MGLKSIWLFGLVTVATQVLAADQYTDGNRPYEFGFNIDGEQHRHEKKDENGLIEGEFGFITADGVYHVTAYATDENGNFRIRSTKNIRIGSPVKKVPEGKALEVPKSPTTPPPSQVISCSHCSIPELTKPPALSDIAVVSQAGQTFSNYPENPDNDRGRQFVPQYVETNQLGDEEPQTPVLISAQMQIVDQNTDIYQLNPGEQPGLPNGVTDEYLEEILYRFNYTVGFHAHYEEGYRNGFKKGYYYITGRNGIKTRVDYVADNDGFHPRISQEVLDALSDDVPKPETEQEERYGLKGYEFKWLYYPVQDRRSNQ